MCCWRNREWRHNAATSTWPGCVAAYLPASFSEGVLTQVGLSILIQREKVNLTVHSTRLALVIQDHVCVVDLVATRNLFLEASQGQPNAMRPA